MTTNTDARTTRRQLVAYQSQAVDTASPERLVSLLFDGALRRIEGARAAMDSTNIEQPHAHLLRAQAIVTELSASLNMKEGGALASSLASLYDFCVAQLVSANVNKDERLLDPVVEILTILRDAWLEMMGGLGARR